MLSPDEVARLEPATNWRALRHRLRWSGWLRAWRLPICLCALDGLLCGSGDAVVGINPAGDNIPVLGQQ